MSKKLLSEAQVRRFQSLASITPLQEMGSPMMDEEYQEGQYNEQPLDEAEDDMGGMDDMGAEDETDLELEEDLVDRFMDAAKTIEEMAQALGGTAGEMDMGDEEPMDDIPADEPAAPPADAPEGEEDEEKDILELALEGVNYQPSQKEIVNEVAKRVAKRIMEAKKAQAKLNRALGNK